MSHGRRIARFSLVAACRVVVRTAVQLVGSDWLCIATPFAVSEVDAECIGSAISAGRLEVAVSAGQVPSRPVDQGHAWNRGCDLGSDRDSFRSLVCGADVVGQAILALGAFEVPIAFSQPPLVVDQNECMS